MFNNPCTFLLKDMNWKDAISGMSYNNTISQGASARSLKFIKAPPEVVYRAFIDSDALAAWQAAGDMTQSPIISMVESAEVTKCLCSIRRPKKNPAARPQKGKTDMSRGSWSLNHQGESLKR